MNKGDLTQHFLGWCFFRSDPWALPLGFTKSFGYPIGINITFTDSIPLFAFFFKLLNPILPPEFQYFGIWELACFILQALFGGLLIRLFFKNFWAQLAGVFFFTTSPLILMRAFGHSSLSGHWIILLSLYLYFLCKNSEIRLSYYRWISICILTILIHPYFTVMSFIIYLGYEADIINRTKKWKSSIIRFFIMVASILAASFLIGIYMPGTIYDEAGLGDASFNLNSLFNPMGWSKFLIKDLPIARPNQYEGFNYLGLGMLILFLISVFMFFRDIKLSVIKDSLKKHSGLFFITIVLILFSLSNVYTFYDKVLFIIPLPEFIRKIWTVYRSTGRMFWPVYYLIYLWIFISLSKQFINGENSWKFLSLLFFAFFIQVIDLNDVYKTRGWGGWFSKIVTYDSPLKSDFWSKAAKTARHIVIIPPGNDDYDVLSYYAVHNKMTMNVGYFARTPWDAIVAHGLLLTDQIRKGNIPADTLFLVRGDKLWNEFSSNSLGIATNIDGRKVFFSKKMNIPD